MTTRITTATLLILSALAVLPASTAAAQCPNGAWLCAEVSIGGRVRPPPPPPPRQQQVIIVETQPAPPPPPRVVYVETQPAPPPVVYVEQQPAPPPVVYQQTTIESRLEVGLHGRVGGVFGQNVQMGGVHGALRLRPNGNDGRFALDLGVGAYGGTDYNGDNRAEVPITVDALMYLNPRDEFQVYLLAGAGVSWAHTEGDFGEDGRNMMHVGGEAGLGVEWRLSRHWAVSADVRGFIRQRVDSDERPEFVDPENGRETDTSGGGVATLGATFYFN